MPSATEPTPMPAEHRKVIVASSLGALFEWYDFYLYGVLAPVFAQHVLRRAGERVGAGGHAAGLGRRLLVRPIGALVLRPARRPDRAQVHVPGHAGADGRGHLRRSACCRDTTPSASAAPVLLVLLRLAAGPGDRRRVRRRGDLCGRACAARSAAASTPAGSRPPRQPRPAAGAGWSSSALRSWLGEAGVCRLGLAAAVPAVAACCWRSASGCA